MIRQRAKGRILMAQQLPVIQKILRKRIPVMFFLPKNAT
jgi:hypothetical protein